MKVKLSIRIARIVGYYLSGPLIIFALVIANQMDYNSEKEQLQVYCENVNEYVWPDYKKIFREKCPSVLDEDMRSN